MRWWWVPVTIAAAALVAQADAELERRRQSAALDAAVISWAISESPTTSPCRPGELYKMLRNDGDPMCVKAPAGGERP